MIRIHLLTLTALFIANTSFSEILYLKGKMDLSGKVFVNKILKLYERSLTVYSPSFITNHSTVFNRWQEKYPILRIRPRASAVEKLTDGLSKFVWNRNIRRGMLLIGYSAEISSSVNLDKPNYEKPTLKTPEKSSFSANKGIKTIVKEITADMPDDYSKILSIVVWVKNNIRLKEDGEEDPERAIGRREANEKGIVNLIAEMGRASGMMTRVVCGGATTTYLPLPDKKRFIIVPSGKFIYWVEFLTSKGWVPVDPMNNIMFFLPPTFVPFGYADSTKNLWKYSSKKITERANSATFEYKTKNGRLEISKKVAFIKNFLIFMPDSVKISDETLKKMSKIFLFRILQQRASSRKFTTSSKYTYNLNYEDEIWQKVIFTKPATLKKVYLYLQKLGISDGEYILQIIKYEPKKKKVIVVATSKRTASSLGLSYSPVKFGFRFNSVKIEPGEYWLVLKNQSPAILSVKAKPGNYIGDLTDTLYYHEGEYSGILNIDVEYQLTFDEAEKK